MNDESSIRHSFGFGTFGIASPPVSRSISPIMNPSPLVLLPLGLLVGVLMGMTSFTGAIIVPALVLCFGIAQADAQGTAMALTLSPVQLPAILNFYRGGHINWMVMKWMVPGVLVGSLIGSQIAMSLPPIVLKTFFGLMTIYVGSYMLLSTTTKSVSKAVMLSFTITAVAGMIVALSKWMEARPAAV